MQKQTYSKLNTHVTAIIYINARLTLPSYSRRERTSGAMYAGVPTVDLGLECKSDDCHLEETCEVRYIKITVKLLTKARQTELKQRPISFVQTRTCRSKHVSPLSIQNHRFSSEVQGFHPKGYSPASSLYDIFAGTKFI